MNRFSLAIFRYLLAQPATKETVYEWLAETGGDREKAALGFATAMLEDFTKEWCKIAAVFDAAFERVNWRRVAGELIDRVAPAKMRPLMTPSLN